MTDCIGILLSSMSTKFNNDGCASGKMAGILKGSILDLNKDKTTKWRSLKKNVNAKYWKGKADEKSNKKLIPTAKKLNSSILNQQEKVKQMSPKPKPDSEDSTQGPQVALNIDGCLNSNHSQILQIGKDASEPVKRRGRSRKNMLLLGIDKNPLSKSGLIKNFEKRFERKQKQKIYVQLKSNRIGSEIEDTGDRSVIISEKEKKQRRSVRLKHRNAVKIDSPSGDEMNFELLDNLKSQVTDTYNVLNVQQRKLEYETSPKKRGPRRKAVANEKNSPKSCYFHTSATASRSSEDSSEKLKIVIPKRSQRRIKPTPKILENDELRYEYQTKNIERITSCIVDSRKNNVSRTSSRHREVEPENSNESLPLYPLNIGNKKNVFKFDYSSEKIEKSCPDIDVFLTEVRAAKWHHSKYPEEKKINNTQQYKLMKQKLKHMERLGLRWTHNDDSCESANITDNKEKFVASRKVQVGKSNVTLRVRGLKAAPTVTISQSPKLTAFAKNTRQKLLAEPTTIEDNRIAFLLKSPNSNHLDEENQKDLICACHLASHYFTQKTTETFFCCAVDQIDEQKIGCCNQVNGSLLNLLRPSPRVGYMILCDDHIRRFRSHNCCAGCGIFCTQGKFNFCKKQHFFHADCAQKFILNSPYDAASPGNFISPSLIIKCPHCGADTPEKTSTVTMKCQLLPIFLPSQHSNIKQASNCLPIVKKPNNAITQHYNNLISTKTNSFGSKTASLEALIPESVMNVVGRTTGRRSNSEFSSEDMFYAVKNDDLERVAEILGSGYDVTSCMREFVDGTCLHLVAYSGTLQMAYLLLCKEFPPNFVNMIDRELKTAAMCAVMSNKCDILNLFTHCGADLGAKGPEGKTCLHIAANLGNFEAVKILVETIKHSKSVTSLLKFVNAQDDGGWTAMVWAAEFGHTEIVRLLLKSGSEPDICDNDNNTVLHWATLYNGSLNIINLLLQAGSDCNIQNMNGDTPLHIACRNSTTRLCLVLIANGADLMVRNKANELPYDCIPREDSECARAIGFNMQMRSFAPMGLRNRIVSSDVSNGREHRPIKAVRNEYSMMTACAAVTASSALSDECDDIILAEFKYITKSIIIQNTLRIDQSISKMKICSCRDGCVSDQCHCTSASVQNWYTDEGRLISDFNYEDPPIIFECNDVCGCNKVICRNRIVQNGIKVPLQISECDELTKGWGVQALIDVPKGSFISEYTGEILPDYEADRRTDDSYFFDIGHDHCIDANYYGNVSRFFNHSCEPNLVPVRVFFDHQDFLFPKIALFSCKNILSGEEMCFDYGEKFWKVKQRFFPCKCRSKFCKYSRNNEKESNNKRNIHIN